MPLTSRGSFVSSDVSETERVVLQPGGLDADFLLKDPELNVVNLRPLPWGLNTPLTFVCKKRRAVLAAADVGHHFVGVRADERGQRQGHER